ncbi:MAG: hypothetical protein LUH48_00790 [Clostridiales bacterium]|nr:hypothetical protein [Clostridiales bacterium]
MVGYLHFVGHGRRVRVAQHDVLGLTVWEARLPGSPESLLARRRMARGLDELEEAGCRRLLAPCPLVPYYPMVHTRSLWQAVAVPLILADLRQRGLEPCRSVVAVRGDRMTRSYLRTCQALAREVKALSLSLLRQETFCWNLQQELGVPLVEGGAAATLSFLPGQWRPGFFPVGDDDPSMGGWRLELPGLTLPDGCPTLPALAALLDAGRLPVGEVLCLPEGRACGEAENAI